MKKQKRKEENPMTFEPEMQHEPAAPTPETQLEEITRLDPQIRSFADLQQQSEYAEFERLCALGLTAAEAFKLANFDVLCSRAARQAAERMRSKAHLMPAGGTAERSVPMPRATYEMYRAALPEWSDGQIRAHWERIKGEEA